MNYKLCSFFCFPLIFNLFPRRANCSLLLPPFISNCSSSNCPRPQPAPNSCRVWKWLWAWRVGRACVLAGGFVLSPAATFLNPLWMVEQCSLIGIYCTTTSLLVVLVKKCLKLYDLRRNARSEKWPSFNQKWDKTSHILVPFHQEFCKNTRKQKQLDISGS